jgi:hypothetical protein
MLKLRLLVPVGVFLGVLIFLVVYFFGLQQAVRASALITPEGVKADVFLPEKSFFVLKIGATDEAQSKNLSEIFRKFPQDEISDAFAGLIAEADSELEEMDLTIENDFMVAVGKNIQAVLAIEMPDNVKDEPAIVGVVVLDDPEKADEILGKMMVKGEHQKQNYGPAAIYLKEGEDGVIARFQDVLVVTRTEADMKRALDRIRDEGKSVLANEYYQKAVEKAGSSVGFVYMGFDSFVELMNDEEFAAEFENQPDLKTVFEAMKSEYFIVSAEEEGFAVYGYIEGDEEKLKEIGLDYDALGLLEPYLLEKVKGDNLILYSESGGFPQMIDIYEKIYGEPFVKVLNALKSILAGMGVSFQDDLLASMDKNYALVVRDAGTFLPVVDIYFDAGSKPESADKIMKAIFLSINNFLEKNNPELVETGVVVSEAREGGREYGLNFNIAALPDEELLNVPEEIKEMSFGFYYGVEENEIAYVAFDSDYHSQTKTVSENEDLQNSRRYIEGYNIGLSYIDVTGILDYTEALLEFAQDFDESLADSNFEDAREIMEYIRPVKNIVTASKESDASAIEMKMFVEIGD